MATPNFSEEEILFRRRARRRLVGAVVLVVAVVAIVPMILPESKPQQDTQQIEIRIPTQDGSGYTSKITPVPEAAPAPQAKAPTVAPQVAPVPAPAVEPSKPVVAAVPSPVPEAVKAVPAKPEVKAEAKPEKPIEAKEVKSAAKSSEPAKQANPSKPAVVGKQTFFVQYGAFSESKNAKQRQAELKAKGVNTFTEVVKTSAGDKIRVRSGPHASRDDAEKVRAKVKPLDSKLVVTGGNT